MFRSLARAFCAITLVLCSALVPPRAAADTLCRPTQLVQFNSCSGGRHVSLAFVGDVLLHRAIATRGYRRGFDHIWAETLPVLRAADLTIANLEGPTATGFTLSGRQVPDPGADFDEQVYTGYPRFNSHPSLIDALRSAGIDIVTLANNHALDRGSAGLDQTLEELRRRGMHQTGAVRAGQSRLQALRVSTPVGTLAFIACTFGVNGLPDPHHQVLRCYSDRRALLDLVRRETEAGAGVVVLPHWGQEYRLNPEPNQLALARDLARAGAIAIIGTHPHVPQPWAREAGLAGLGVPVVYSTGNFIAAQTPLERATGQLAWLDLCRGASGRAQVAGAGFIPLQMAFTTHGPLLTLPHQHDHPRARNGVALLRRQSPGLDLSGQLSCRRGRAPQAPVSR